MFLHDKALHPTDPEPPDTTPLIRASFREFLLHNELCAGFFCVWDDDEQDTSFIIAEGMPDAPFVGSRHYALVDFLKECLQYYPAPHVHSISRSKLWSEISSVTDVSGWQLRVLFIPAYLSEKEFLFLCFSSNKSELRVPSDISNSASAVLKIAGLLLESQSLSRRLRVMELYVREIGHDIASSVQAIVAKLRNVSRGLLQGKAAIEKVLEAEEEIMSAYRIADTLGITVDPDYNIGGGDDFDAREVVTKTLVYCRSEAEERHIELRPELPNGCIPLWGDEKGLQSALMQLIMNAIKYAKGSSFVTVRTVEKNSDVEFSVTDLGKPLDETEQAHMWEFGWRGEKAKELHVNGSGIGLYTVRKIAQAHGGTFGALNSPKTSGVVTVFFRIPKRDILRKSMLLVAEANKSLQRTANRSC